MNASVGSVNASEIPAVSLTRTVPFYELDPLRIVWHGNYFKYFEQAREALMASVGLSVHDFEALGYRLVMVDTRCRYLVPLTFGQRFEVRAWFKTFGPWFEIAYLVTDADTGRKHTRAWTKLALTAPEGRLLTEMPDDVLSRVRGR